MRHWLLILLLCLPLAVDAQKRKKPAKATPQPTESREVKKLRDEKSSVQRELKDKEKKLITTKQNVNAKQKEVAYIEHQISERVAYVHSLEQRIDSIDAAMTALEGELEKTARSLEEKKARYGEGLRYARSQQLRGGGMGIVWFALQAGTLQQMYRRARYAREYTVHQETLGRQIMAQQSELNRKKSRLLAYKGDMNTLVTEISTQRSRLVAERRVQQNLLNGLRVEQKSLTNAIDKQRQRLVALDKKIDEVITREIEAARKKAEEAERRRLAEASSKKKENGTTASSSSSSGSSRGKASTSTASSSSSSRSSSSSKGKGSGGGAFITTADRELSGSFERNKGRLPVPISGSYRIGARMGTYQVMKGVHLESKGTNYIGHPGACARAIFNGEVTTIFAYGGMTNVMVRHGSYISVYCNLSSVRVRQGQKVNARDLLGAVGVDERGETTLIFQLRRETKPLNPEAWIAR